MKLLVLSDSHSALSFMRLCIRKLQPDAVAHLGDYFEDGSVMAEEFPQMSFYQVPGNCDRYRNCGFAPETLVQRLCGVKLFMTHGHLHQVKYGLETLIRDARSVGAQAVLFGHTHSAYCQLEDGLWVVNPGCCGSYGGSAAVLELMDGAITDCRIIRSWELE